MKVCLNCKKRFNRKRRVTCSDECHLAMVRKINGRKKYYHDFLPPDDEANILGYWVPSPEQIAEGCVEVRNMHEDERDWRELTGRQRRLLFSARRKELSKKGAKS